MELIYDVKFHSLKILKNVNLSVLGYTFILLSSVLESKKGCPIMRSFK